jgi:hypothetical protein
MPALKLKEGSMHRLCLIVCLSVAAPAHAQVTMRWKLEPGDRFRLESVEQQKQKLQTAGKMTEMESTITTTIGISVLKSAASGVLAEIKIESVKVNAAQGRGSDGELAKMMSGATFLATITPQGEIIAFEGFDAFIKNLAAARGQSERLLRTLITEEGVKKGIGEYFSFLPTAAVTQGDAWERTGLMPLGPLGSLQTRNEYTYEGKREGNELISYKATLTYVPSANTGDVFKVVKGDLQGKTAEGSLLFDAVRGRLVQAHKRLVLRGELTLEVAGNRVEMTFDMAQSTKVRLLAD